MGSSPLIYKYPLDLTGINPNNLVVSEPHTLPAGTNRAFVPNYGAFFTRSLIVRDFNGNELTPKVQFKAVQLYQEATEKTGLEVATVIVITDDTVSSDIQIDYQAIGGEFSYSVLALREMLETLDLDNRPVEWGDVIGTPDHFPPAPHLHDAGDLYGFEYLTEALDAVRRAIQTGNEGAFNLILEKVNDLNKRILPKATIEDAMTGARSDVLITPHTLKAAFDYWIDISNPTLFDEHINGGGNPHYDEAQDIGLDNLVAKTPASLGEIDTEMTNLVNNLS